MIWRIALEKAGRGEARRSAAGFLLCPAVIVLSAYHGNTDSILASLLLAGAWAAHRGRWALAGFLLGAAVNVKLLALAGVVAVIFSVRRPRDLGRLALGASLTVVPFLLVLAADHATVIDKVFGYVPFAEPWGLPWMASGFSPDYVLGRNAIASWYLKYGAWIVATALVVTAITSRIRGSGAIPAAFIGTAAYLVFTPSIGIQHLAIALPLAFAMPTRSRWHFPAVASLFLLAVYGVFLVIFLALSTNTGRWPLPVAMLGFLVWLSAGLVMVTGLYGTRHGAHAASPEQDSCGEDAHVPSALPADRSEGRRAHGSSTSGAERTAGERSRDGQDHGR